MSHLKPKPYFGPVSADTVNADAASYSWSVWTFSLPGARVEHPGIVAGG